MNLVETGVMLPGAELVDEGNINFVWRGLVKLHDRTVHAYVKELEPREIFIECLTALLGIHLKLSIPKPILVLIDHRAIPDAAAPGQPIIGFGSEDVGYPNLWQKVDRNLPRAKDLLKECKAAPRVAGFDEWIANADRNLGNVLYGGNGEFAFIDHEKAIPPRLLPQQAANQNFIMDVISDGTDISQKYEIKNSIFADVIDVLDKEFLKSIPMQFNFFEDMNYKEATGIISFLEDRLFYVNDLIIDRLGISQLELRLC